MMRPTRLALAALAVFVASAPGADLVVLPPAVTLDGPRATHTLVVERRDGDRLVGDVTADAAFSTDNPAVAVVGPNGLVSPVADGAATVTAKVGNTTAAVKVIVKNAKAPVAWSFKNHVLPVMTRVGCNSGACHGAAAGKGGLRLTLRGYGPEVDYDVLTRQASARRINKTTPAESLFLLKPTAAVEHGGGRRIAPDSPDYRVLAEWIASGLSRPRDDEPTLTSISAFPNAVRLAPGATQRLVVQAAYSDGRVEDVTRWAKFGSTDESVAKVDDDGRIRVEGRGEAAVTVWFSSLVQTVLVTSPYPATPDPAVFAKAPRVNAIDELNLTKLEGLGIPPSPDCGDSAFLRRAYLDATGTLPPAAEVDAFLADEDPKKREKLVDRLLNCPEYVDYWAYKWSDVLLVSSKKLPAPAMWAFYRFVRRAVEEDRPWDRFARDLLTAKGSTLTNGAANYFVLHRDPIDLTESTSMAFLGMSLTCARCHNHPMEKWTQDQYYGMANLFSRVTLKDTGVAGEVIVAASPEGDVRHPRRGTVPAPQPLDGKAVPIESRGDRREVFADWLAGSDNPYFSRALVNRVWRNFFGRGLIDPEDDLRATNPPSDPALIDRLTADFVKNGYGVKSLIRTIMTSAAYARSSDPAHGNEADEKFLSRYRVKRLPAEVLLDAIARVTEVPTDFAGYPPGWRSQQLPDVQVASTFLTAFGRPERVSTCSCERSAEPSVAQALHLANGETLNTKLRAPNGAISRLAASKESDAELLDGLFKAALSRPPTPAERDRLLPLLAGATEGATNPAEARRQAIEDLYWSVLTSKEFLFNH